MSQYLATLAKKGLSDDLTRDLNERERGEAVCRLSIPGRGSGKGSAGVRGTLD